MKRFTLLFILGLAAFTSYAQDFSNKGKDFWLGYGWHCRMTPANGNTQQMVLYFATEAATNVTVAIPSLGYSVNYAIPANTIFTTSALPKTGVQDARLTTEGVSNKGIHVTSDKPIVAYAHIYNGSISGATLLFPTNTLGREYYSINFTQHSNEGNSNCFFYAVATDTGTTTIEIIPSANTQTMLAGQTYTFNLQQGEVFNALGVVAGNNGEDLTGSKIRSVSTAASGCKPIAVFSGSGKINIKCPVGPGTGSADNYMVQSFPQTAWGKRFLTAPTANFPNNFFRICVSDPATVVKVNGVTQTGIIGNFYYQLGQASTPYFISANKPITVAQYITSQGVCGNGSPGDPEVIYLSPIEQNISKVILNSTPNSAITQHYINVIIPSTGVTSFRLDGIGYPTSFTNHPQLTGYSYAQLGVGQGVTAGQHTILSDSGFNAIAYGYGSAESYGYNAGTNIKDLFQTIVIKNQFATVSFPATCVNTPFTFAITLPYQATKLVWDFHGTFPNVTNNNPVPDSSYVVEGKTVYLYRLPTPYTYAAIGTFPITVFATNPTPEGCSGVNEIDYDVQVFDKPRANWAFLHSGCLSDSVRFIDSTNGQGRPVIKWKWDFGDNTTDSVKNPLKLYTAGGSYPVKLNIITDVGCIADTTKIFNVSAPPFPKFGASVPNCPDVPVIFTDSSSVASGSLVKWYWDYGNGQKDTLSSNISRTITYATAGTYIVKLVVQTNTGCKSFAFIDTVVIHPNPVVNFSFPYVCLPDSARFSDLSTIADGSANLFKYKWNFGDGGIDSVKNPSHLYTGTGPFNVKLVVTSNNGCIDDTIKAMTSIYAQPKAGFNMPSEVCFKDTVQYTDISTAANSTVTRWRWSFGDGVTDTVQNPKYVYASPGAYTVKLYAFSAIGCLSDTATKQIVVNQLPTPGFTTSSPKCENRAITFTDTSKANSGVLTTWKWDFGDGTTDVRTNGSAFTHIFLLPGIYTVKLKVASDKGCNSTEISKIVTVTAVPFVDFKTPRICLPSGTGQFNDLSTISDGTAGQFTYAWEFGDGGTATIKDPTHKFATTGPFSVKLTVTSNNGCVKDTTKTFSDIFARPTAQFMAPAEVCLRDTTYFTDGSIANNQTITQWRWTFGNGKSDTLQNPKHLYTAAGTYTVKLFVYSNEGCISDTASRQLIINPIPTVAFISSTPVCETKQVLFTNQSVANAGNITRWYWNMGDSRIVDTTNGNPFSHAYAAAGNYKVQLYVSTDKGCRSDTFNKNVTINAQPVAAFILPEVCLSDAFAQFTDSSYIADGTAGSFTYAWNFGDAANSNSGNPNTSTLKNPKHKYLATGVYNVTTTVTTINGCVHTLVKQLIVNGDIPVSRFNILNSAGLCSNVKVDIQNKSTVNFGALTKTEIFWDWANSPAIKDVDDSPAPDKIYSHLYPNFQSPLTKTFQVRFLAYSGGICVDDTVRTITLNASPKTAFTTMPGICLDAAPSLITQARETGGVPGIFSFSGPGVSATGLFDPVAAGVATHTIKYLFVSNAGCRDSITQTKTVWPRPDAKWGYSAPTCESKAVTFTDTSVANFSQLTQWKWKFGDATSQNNTSGNPFTHIYTAAGSFVAELQVVTDSGCTSLPVQKTITVNPLPKTNFSLPTVCLPGGIAQFNDSTTIADGTESQFTYLWNFGDGGTSTIKNPVHNYSTTGPFNVSLTVTSNNGCADTKTKSLTDLNPQLQADFTALPPSVCLGDIIAFGDRTNPLNQTLANWFWDFGDGRSGTLKNMSHLYTSPGTYNVKLYTKTNKGCFSDTAIKPVIVYAYPVVNAGPDLVVLQGGQVKINATTTNASGYRYRWTPPTWLDNDSILAPTVVMPQTDMTYKLTVTANGGCSDDDDVFVKLLLAPVIPNAFSPNKDGINDTWIIQYLDSYPGAGIQLFDRYGQIVFSSVGYNKPFDGKLNGTDLPVGVYYYIVDPKNGRKPITGSLTLLR